MKKHAIITCSDSKHERFLLNHWLVSLKTNVNLKNVDVLVIDYGLSGEVVQKLKKQGVIVQQGRAGGHVVTARFIDLLKILEQSNYGQVLFIDGGDIIFQEDIPFLFDDNKDVFRVTKLNTEVLFFEFFIPKFQPKSFQKELWRVLNNKPVLNAGVIFAPRQKFINLCQKMEELISNKNTYGADQIIFNYVLHKDKFVLLDKKYNFMFGIEREGFLIRNGVFFRKNGEKIAIAHNAGHENFLRPIANFGFGKNCNKLKPVIYYGRKILFLFFGLIKNIQKNLFNFFC